MSERTELPEGLLDRVRSLCLALPEVSLRVDESLSPLRSTAYAFDIRKRSFCLLVARADPAGVPVSILVLRADPEEREALLASGHPYFPSRAGTDRLGVVITGETDWDELRELIVESCRRLAPKKLSAQID